MAWLPVYHDDRAKGLRPASGFDSTAARKMRLYHRCWIEFLDGWEARTRDALILTWSDGVQRSTRIFFGGVLGDQQEGDKFTAEPVVCHRCTAAGKDCLKTDTQAHVKTSQGMRLKVEATAAGAHMEGKSKEKWIVKWDQDRRNAVTCVQGQVQAADSFNLWHSYGYSHRCQTLRVSTQKDRGAPVV